MVIFFTAAAPDRLVDGRTLPRPAGRGCDALHTHACGKNETGPRRHLPSPPHWGGEGRVGWGTRGAVAPTSSSVLLRPRGRRRTCRHCRASSLLGGALLAAPHPEPVEGRTGALQRLVFCFLARRPV